MATGTKEDLIVRVPSDLTKEWLSSKFNAAVSSFKTEKIGTGQVSHCHRVSLDYVDPKSAGPSSVILKVASDDSSSKESAQLLNLYQQEVKFYTEIFPHLHPGSLSPVYHAAYYEDDNTFCLLLGDATPAVVGNEIEGTTIEKARLAMRELGKLQASTINSTKMQELEWLNRPSPLDQQMFQAMFKEWVERYEKRVKPAHMVVCSSLVSTFDQFEAERKEKETVWGLVHGDYRLDNLLFGESGSDRELTIVDWQTLFWGPLMSDAAYFLGCALDPALRREHTDELLKIYHEALGSEIVTLETCRESLRRQAFFGVVMAIVSPIFVERTERGDDLFMTLIARHCQQVLDLDSLDMLPRPAALVPLSPALKDEGRHPPGKEHFWQESYYMDFADLSQGIGGYVRLGVDPARNRTWYTAVLAGPGRPSVAIVDFHAPLPDADMNIKASDFESKQKVNDPLKSYTVTVKGTARSYADPSMLLQKDWDTLGKPVPVTLDLTWVSDGTPYKYRITTRYEIPCLITGSISIGSETIKLDAVPGQRDHSWGARDWWSADWVWSALHLDEKTHIHGLDLRVPSGPRLSLGYVQNAPKEQKITELSSNLCEEAFHDNGLTSTATWTIKSEGMEDIVANMEILGHGPLRLEADDGRVALFPRAWGKIKTEDGREGVAWAEWNKN
ncbi:hypothetical protein P152DRAFT_476708 [Eremomyces bilateralis CBS 781.70]|uniref:CHK kinase-like domain-containing protein n=1 Tax=Eremomyces bilateralis CBS 781.70 TaxID=1392243 RepID=A0A6G1FTP6_9PEZI|nr:uncharacterized protein P152DRAFT_476708 [Eremomyces bilateralis CBS 781.70]KAF1809144.1 hypothetical protein P152DRAFT_476708 [Eremomyces bilateralis CBS 781.70]